MPYKNFDSMLQNMEETFIYFFRIDRSRTMDSVASIVESTAKNITQKNHQDAVSSCSL